MKINLDSLKRKLEEVKKNDSVRICEMCGFEMPCVCDDMDALILEEYLSQEALQAINFMS